jgi:hypothetical protein
MIDLSKYNAEELTGVHDYETIGSQNTQGVVGGFSMTPIMREVKNVKDVVGCILSDMILLQMHTLMKH